MHLFSKAGYICTECKPLWKKSPLHQFHLSFYLLPICFAKLFVDFLMVSTITAFCYTNISINVLEIELFFRSSSIYVSYEFWSYWRLTSLIQTLLNSVPSFSLYDAWWKDIQAFKHFQALSKVGILWNHDMKLAISGLKQVEQVARMSLLLSRIKSNKNT